MHKSKAPKATTETAIDLPLEIIRWAEGAAARRGISVNEYVVRLLEDERDREGKAVVK